MKLNQLDKAPDFSAHDQHGKLRTLADFLDKKLILYFYPKDDTPGCTKEACGLRDNFDKLSSAANIVGVSADSVDSHAAFAKKYNLPFTLLADTDKEIITAYGATGLLFPSRVTFLISQEGIIEKVYEKVTPDTHANEILADLS